MSDIIHTIAEPTRGNEAKPLSGFALFRLGFRPFFLLGSIYGALALVYFILLFSGGVEFLPSRWDALTWHRHEMLFGFAAAIIAGFLFTAVPNWTGHPTPKGTALALIAGLWMLGRVMVFFSSHFPSFLVAAVDIAFPLACAAGILPALVKSKNRRNYFFIALLLLLAFANALAHREAEAGIWMALNIVILMMIVVGGRVIPFFTERALGINILRDPRIERLALISALAALVLDVFLMGGKPVGIAFGLAAIASFWRLSQWKTAKTLSVPLLWVLHAGYAWLVAGFALKAAYCFGLDVPRTIAVHAFTAGGIGTLTLGMIARVSLGHSGRPLAAGRPMTLAFVCINLAALLRVFGVWLLPDLAPRLLETSALLWLLAFGTFIWIYAPILLRPRVDGRDG